MKQKQLGGFTLVETLVGISLAAIFITMFVQIYMYTSAAMAAGRVNAAVIHIANKNLAPYRSLAKLHEVGLKCDWRQLHTKANPLQIPITDTPEKDFISTGSLVIVSQAIHMYYTSDCFEPMVVESIVSYKRTPKSPEETIKQVVYVSEK